MQEADKVSDDTLPIDLHSNSSLALIRLSLHAQPFFEHVSELVAPVAQPCLCLNHTAHHIYPSALMLLLLVTNETVRATF